MQRILGYFIACTLGAGLSLAANDVPIRLNPATEAPVIKRVSKTDPIVKNAITITNAGLAQKGWMRSSDLLMIEGFLAADKLSKNFEIEINAKVFEENDLSGSPITRIQANDPIELLEINEKWAHIRIQKVLPVYFQLGAHRDPLPIYVPPTRANPIKVDTTRFNPNLKVGITRPEALPPENVVWTGTAERVDLPEKPTATPAAPQSTLAQAQDHPHKSTGSAQPDGRIYRLTGKLIRAINNEAPRYSLQLQDTTGTRVAYVDVSQMYIEDIRSYTNQTVFIHGEVSLIAPDSTQLVIIARTIRISE